MSRIDGQVAIITGAGHGMGQAAARLFASAGATIAVADVRLDAAQVTAGAITDAGGTALPIAFDATKDDSVAAMVAEVIATLGRIDILWNCVGGVFWRRDATRPTTTLPGDGDILSIEPDYWIWQLELNLNSVYYCCRHVLPHMISNGRGAIISMATGGALDAHESGEGFHPYNVAKSGVVTLSRLIAKQYGPKGIRSNVIIPGTVNSWPNPKSEAHAIRRSALRRIGTVEEVAKAGLFLASDDSSYITGEELRLDGGTHVWGNVGYAS